MNRSGGIVAVSVQVRSDGKVRCEISKCNQIEDGKGNVRLEVLP